VSSIETKFFCEEVNIRTKIAENSKNIDKKKSTAFGNRRAGMGKSEGNWDKFSNYKKVIIPQVMISYCFYILCYYLYIYTECPGRNVLDFRRMFLKLKYTDITKNTYIRS